MPLGIGMNDIFSFNWSLAFAGAAVLYILRKTREIVNLANFSTITAALISQHDLSSKHG